MEGYAYDRERSKAFDDQRREIVHGKALGKPLTLFQLSDDNVEYLLRTGFYFLLLINFKYGLWFDIRQLSGSPRESQIWRAPEHEL